MIRLAVRQLCFEPARTVWTVLAIAAVLAVIVVLRGFEQGLYDQSRDAVLRRGADLFVSQAGIANFVAVRSSLRQRARREVEAVAGVHAAYPVTGFPVIYEKHGHKAPVYLMVYDVIGGPDRLQAGRLPAGPRDVVVDRSLLRGFDLSIGDPLVISDFGFRICGVAHGAAAFFMPFVFVTYDGLLDFVLQSDIAPDLSVFPLVSHLLVSLDPAADPARVAAAIEATVPDVDVYTAAALAANDVATGRSLFGPVMGLLTSIAHGVGLLVVAFIVYADVRSRLRSFGVLKALGFRMSQLASGVVARTSIVLLAAFPVGIATAAAVAGAVEQAAPLYRVPVLGPDALLHTLAAAILLAAVGGLLPLRLIAAVDPVVAFRKA